MTSLRKLLFLRYAVAVVLVLVLVAAVILFSLHARLADAVVLLVGTVALLGVLAGITIWTQKTLSEDIAEIGAAMEKLVVEHGIDRMPQPRIAELSDLAQDMDTVAARVHRQYRLLSDERDRLGAILDNINVGIIAVGRDGKISLINPVAEKILGTTRDFALGRTFTEIHHTPAIDRAVQRSGKGAVVSEEVRISLPRKRRLRFTASPIEGADGRVSGVIAILEDITTRRRLERTRRDFVANVSHELRTPVANMRAVVDALVAGAAEDESAARRFTDDLDKESRRLAFIIEDLLVLSRMESDELEMSEDVFDLTALIEEIAEEKREMASGSEVTLEVEGAGDRVSVRGDRKLMKTALANLVDNAIKYNMPGGRVEMSVGEAGGEVSLTVSDTGIGIPARDQSRVFERFYRVDKARSRETGGTGLGLSIVKHVAELHGGTVSVVSSEGSGAKFTITVPAPTSLF